MACNSVVNIDSVVSGQDKRQYQHRRHPYHYNDRSFTYTNRQQNSAKCCDRRGSPTSPHRGSPRRCCDCCNRDDRGHRRRRITYTGRQPNPWQPMTSQSPLSPLRHSEHTGTGFQTATAARERHNATPLPYQHFFSTSTRTSTGTVLVPTRLHPPATCFHRRDFAHESALGSGGSPPSSQQGVALSTVPSPPPVHGASNTTGSLNFE